MRPLRSMRALLFLSVVGCASPATPAVDAAGRDAGDAGNVPALEIGLRGDGAVFTPWSDGEVIALVWGAQGGVMLTPTVSIDGRLVAETDPTLEIALTNIDPTTGMQMTSFPGYGPVRSVFARLDQRLVNGPIQDQLAWTDIAGQHVILRAHVSGLGVDLTAEVEVVLAAAGAMPPPPDCSDAMPCFDGRGLDAGMSDGGS